MKFNNINGLAYFKDDTQSASMSLVDLEYYLEMTRREILEKHPAAITELKNGRYKGYYQTFITDSVTGKRKNVRAKSQKELENKLIQLYSLNSKKHTIAECFNAWIEDLKINKKPSTIHTYEKVFNRHFSEIKDRYIEDLSVYEIKLFVKKEVANKGLSSKGYASLKTDLLGIYHYANDMEIIDIHIDDIVADLSRQLRGTFHSSKKASKKDDDFIFYDDEISLITRYCLENDLLVDLGILLLFGTGLRVGELAALKNEDIGEDFKTLFISRTEERIGNGATYIVSETTKTETGTRMVLLTKDVSKLLKKISEKSAKNSEYLFSDESYERYPAKKFRDRLYRLCLILGIPKRSPHDIRRTYASKLYESGVPENLIIKQMGHIDFDVTKEFYIYNRKSMDELIGELEKAI